MENRNTRLGGVSRRRALGDLTSQLNNRPANFQNQDTLQPIKPQVRIFGFSYVDLLNLRSIWAIFGTLWSIDHCDWKILPPADALCSSIQSKGRPMNWFNGTFFIRFDVVYRPDWIEIWSKFYLVWHVIIKLNYFLTKQKLREETFFSEMHKEFFFCNM